MEWLGLVLWAIVVMIALPLAAAGSLAAPSLGLHSILSIAGLVLTVLYVALSGGRWMATVAGALALAATLAVADGAARLTSDAPRAATAGQAAEEQAAGLAGVQLFLLLTVAFSMFMAAGGITTIG